MLNLLYCKSGIVLAVLDVSQKVPASTYGAGVSVIPCQNMPAMARIGAAPPPRADGRAVPDTRPLVAPEAAMPADLIAYAEWVEGNVQTGGFNLNLAPAGQAARNVWVSTTASSLTNYLGLYLLAAQNPAYSSTWLNNDGTTTTVNAAQIVQISNAAVAHVQASFNALAAVIGGVMGGSIASVADVDGAAWPSNA